MFYKQYSSNIKIINFKKGPKISPFNQIVLGENRYAPSRFKTSQL